MLSTKMAQSWSPKSFSLTETSRLYSELVCPPTFWGWTDYNSGVNFVWVPKKKLTFPKLLCILDGLAIVVYLSVIQQALWRLFNEL